jgi:hypothetical protein
MATAVRFAMIVAVYGALMLAGAGWMVWLKLYVRPVFLQGGLWVLFFLPAMHAAHRFRRWIGRRVAPRNTA